ncbi:MAG: hypothetical protein COW71_14940 [Ignavibacteriales bacterium CG18_big_fil_WC_8_21_14_2_50_31_20]|nr:MAG: hypothetical protein COW71_14940 [Ignavibacteriales bacterium CG18_big_fil_WC_8_21_14_2_50_31_20]
MRKIILIISFIFAVNQNIIGQYLYSSNADTLDVQIEFNNLDLALINKFNPQKPLWIPVVESVTQSFMMGAFNFVTGSEFAKIGISTIKHNFERGWATDADGFPTNMVGHPLQGTVYFNLARSSGYNYWVSLGVASIGSWQWEYFMENEPPSLNDQIMTSYGGSLIGEVFFKLSNLIIDESTVGTERFFRELGAGIFNPGRLFNRLIYGRASRVTNSQLYKKDHYFGEIAFGGNYIAEGTDFESGEKNPMLTFDFTYGRLFKNSKIKPFDFFRLRTAINFKKQPLIGQLNLYNIFVGNVISYENKSRFLYGVLGYFDYLENNVYQIGATGIGLGIGYRTQPQKNIQFIGTLNVGSILMGGANSDYAADNNVDFLDSARTYNMGPGALLKAEALLKFSFGSFYLGYNFWWIHTWDGAPGDELIGMLAPKFRVRVYENWFIGSEYLYYHRRGKYADLENRSFKNNEVRIFIGYAF